MHRKIRLNHLILHILKPVKKRGSMGAMKKERRTLAVILSLCLFAGLGAARGNAEEVRCYEAESCFSGGAADNEDRVNILLIGQDHREGEPGQRSDSMIICSFFPKEKRLILTSILRDLYVKIPGYGYERINAAYSRGGKKLLKKTLQENFGISIQGTMEADFTQFSGIIDLLGGVELELRPDEAREISRRVPDHPIGEGMQTLNGPQALAYARIRCLDPDADFSRTARQRKLLESMIGRYRELNFTDMVKLLKLLIPAVNTDLNYFELLTYGKLFLPMLKDLQVESRRIPHEGGARDEKVRGMWVLMPDLGAIKRKNQDIIE